MCLNFSLCFALSSSTEDLAGTLEKHIQETMEKGYELRFRQGDCEGWYPRESCQKVNLSLHMCSIGLELVTATVFLPGQLGSTRDPGNWLHSQ